MSTQAVLQVPVVYYDLRRQEGLHQVFDSLDTLNGVVEEVFTRISARVRTKIMLLKNISSQFCQF